jgi:hypothetical protein
MFGFKKINRLVVLSSLLLGSVGIDLNIAPIAFASPTNWGSSASEHRGRLEQDFTYNCPSGGRVGTVWGTDIYTDDSSVCSAAVHAGLITAKQGGVITIRIKPGESSYVGTKRNGVSSNDYGGFGGSFIFLNRKSRSVSEPVSTNDIIPPLKWGNSATSLRGRLEQDFTYNCPAGGRVGTVWGTRIYTDDSSVCSAAVHAGLITAKQGGVITIRIKPGESSYVGTKRNGVNSSDYGSFSGSYVFVK